MNGDREGLKQQKVVMYSQKASVTSCRIYAIYIYNAKHVSKTTPNYVINASAEEQTLCFRNACRGH